MAKRPERPEFVRKITDLILSDDWWCEHLDERDEHGQRKWRARVDPEIEEDGGGWMDYAGEFLGKPILRMLCAEFGHRYCNNDNWCDYCDQERK